MVFEKQASKAYLLGGRNRMSIFVKGERLTGTQEVLGRKEFDC